MQEFIISIFLANREIAIIISIGINILISVLGVVPSFFLTAANLLVFGFWQGVLISAIGESLGAYVSFVLYRKGFKNVAMKKTANHRYLQRLLQTKGSEAFNLILALRIFPFLPSGLITITAAVGSVNVLTFVVASSIGKLPALLMEAYSVHQIINWNTQGKIIVGVLSALVIFFLIKKMIKKP